MPMIQIRYASPQPRGADLPAVLAATATQLGAEILRKDPKVTAVAVDEVPARNWFCGGESLAALQKAAFWLDIRVTDGTNTKDEKAAFVAVIYAAFAKLLGPLHEESYVHVFDVRDDAYGFGGLTQGRRYIAGKLGVPAQQAA